MGKAYGMDLRARVMADVDEGLPIASVARKYRVSAWWIHQLKKRRLETGSLALGRHGGHKPRGIKDADMLTSLVGAHPDATLSELQALLKERGIEVKISTLWYNLKYAGLSLKKNRARLRAGA